MDAPVAARAADWPSRTQEVDEEDCHGAEDNGHGNIDHPVIGEGLRRRRDARRGRSAAGADPRAHVVAPVDAQPLLRRVHDPDQIGARRGARWSPGCCLGRPAVQPGNPSRRRTRCRDRSSPRARTSTSRTHWRRCCRRSGTLPPNGRRTPSPALDGSVRLDTAVRASRGVAPREPLGRCGFRRRDRKSDRSQADQRHGCRQNQETARRCAVAVGPGSACDRHHGWGAYGPTEENAWLSGIGMQRTPPSSTRSHGALGAASSGALL